MPKRSSENPLDREAGEAGVAPDRTSTTRTPRWVKVFALIGFLLFLLLVVMLVSGQGHGPGRHAAGGGEMPSLGHAAAL